MWARQKSIFPPGDRGTPIRKSEKNLKSPKGGKSGRGSGFISTPRHSVLNPLSETKDDEHPAFSCGKTTSPPPPPPREREESEFGSEEIESVQMSAFWFIFEPGWLLVV